jgi:hypothetical protein
VVVRSDVARPYDVVEYVPVQASDRSLVRPDAWGRTGAGKGPEGGLVPTKLPRPPDTIEARPPSETAPLPCEIRSCHHAAMRIASDGSRRDPHLGAESRSCL